MSEVGGVPFWTQLPAGSGGGVTGPGGAGSSTDNAIVRWDGTTGTAIQNSAITVSDVSGASVTLATTAGNALVVAATAPTATTGASQAGKSVGITASAAVASTDTAGAAAGGSVTITAGAAARNASGNANGGDIFLVTGAGIGTGTAGVVGFFGTTSSFPGLAQRTGSAQFQITDAARSGRGTAWTAAIGINGTLDNYSANDVYLTQTGNSGASVRLSSGNALGWTSGADGAQSPDAGISRSAAADIAFGNGTAGNATATLKFGGGRCRGLTSSAAGASTTEYPTDGDWGIHKNTTTGVSSLARNDGGAIKTAAMA